MSRPRTAIAVLLLLSFSNAAADDFHYLIKNSTFDEGFKSWTPSEESDWKVENGIVKSDRLRDPSLAKNVVSESTLSQCVDTEGLDGFKAAFRFKFTTTPQSTPVVAWILSYSEKGCTGQAQVSNYFSPQPNSEWQIIANPKVVLSMGAKSAKFQLLQPGERSGSNPRYWDDVLFTSTTLKENKIFTDNLQELKVGVNLLKNGDFAHDVDQWKLFYGSWSEEGRTAKGSAVTKIQSTSGGMGIMVGDQCVELGSNEIYSYKASFKKGTTTGQTGNGNIRVIWYEQPGCNGPSSYGDQLTERDRNNDDACNVKKESSVIKDEKDEWIHMELNALHRPASAASARIEMGQTIDSAGQFEIFWDDLSFAPQ